jgi:nucleoside 2-deoxyribosyltransferase
MRVYLAGPMRGKPFFNFPAFHAADASLRKYGYRVFNPAEFDEGMGFDPKRDTPKPLKCYMEHDLAEVCRSDMVVMLPGWRKSVGASLEVHVARVCGIPCVPYQEEPDDHRGGTRLLKVFASTQARTQARKQAVHGAANRRRTRLGAGQD